MCVSSEAFEKQREEVLLFYPERAVENPSAWQQEAPEYFTMGWKKEYLAVGESLVAGSKALGKWKVADMTIGLSYLGEARREQLKEDPGLKTRGLENSESVSMERLETFEWACDLAEIAYIGEESVMRKLLQEMDLTLVHGEVESKFAGKKSRKSPTGGLT